MNPLDGTKGSPDSITGARLRNFLEEGHLRSARLDNLKANLFGACFCRADGSVSFNVIRFEVSEISFWSKGRPIAQQESVQRVT